MAVRYLNQIIGMQQDIRRETERALTDAYHALQKPGMMEGIHKTYETRVEKGAELPEEYQRVQATATEMIDETRRMLVRLFDITAARDFTNGPGLAEGGATADVVVGERVLVRSAPVPYLLWLDDQIKALLAFASKLPVLPSTTEWELLEDRGVYRSRPAVTARQVQQPKTTVVVPPTERHPAQTVTVNETFVEGYWTTYQLSGAVPLARRSELLRRLHALRNAVTVAREEANRVEAMQPAVGEAVLGYIFD